MVVVRAVRDTGGGGRGILFAKVPLKLICGKKLRQTSHLFVQYTTPAINMAAVLMKPMEAILRRSTPANLESPSKHPSHSSPIPPESPDRRYPYPFPVKLPPPTCSLSVPSSIMPAPTGSFGFGTGSRNVPGKSGHRLTHTTVVLVPVPHGMRPAAVTVARDAYRDFSAPTDTLHPFRARVQTDLQPPLWFNQSRVNVEVIYGAQRKELLITGFPVFMGDRHAAAPCEVSIMNGGLVRAVASSKYTVADTLNATCFNPAGGRNPVVDRNPANPQNLGGINLPGSIGLNFTCPFYCPDPANTWNKAYQGADKPYWDGLSCLVPIGYDPKTGLEGDARRCLSRDRTRFGQVLPDAVLDYIDPGENDISTADCHRVCSRLNRLYVENNKCDNPGAANTGDCICGPTPDFGKTYTVVSTKYTKSTTWPSLDHKCETGDNLAQRGFVDQNFDFPEDPEGNPCPFYCPDVKKIKNKRKRGSIQKMWSTLSCLIAVGYDPQFGTNNSNPSQCKRVGQAATFWGQSHPVPVKYHQYADIDAVDCDRAHTGHNFCKEPGSRFGNCFCGPNFDATLRLQISMSPLATAATIDLADQTFFESFNQSFAACHGEGVVYERSGRALNDQVCTVAAWGRAEKRHVACHTDRIKTQAHANDTHTSFACVGSAAYARDGDLPPWPHGNAMFPRRDSSEQFNWNAGPNISAVIMANGPPGTAQQLATGDAASLTMIAGRPIDASKPVVPDPLRESVGNVQGAADRFGRTTVRRVGAMVTRMTTAASNLFSFEARQRLAAKLYQVAKACRVMSSSEVVKFVSATGLLSGGALLGEHYYRKSVVLLNGTDANVSFSG